MNVLGVVLPILRGINRNLAKGFGTSYQNFQGLKSFSSSFKKDTLDENRSQSMSILEAKGLTSKQASEVTKWLKKDDLLDLMYHNFTAEQLLNPCFGKHTLRAAHDLHEGGIEITKAISMVDGLNESEACGVANHGLIYAEVKTKNFGPHTLEAICALKEHKKYTAREAFDKVAGLDRVQTLDVLSKENSQSISLYRSFMWDVERILRATNPQVEDSHIYKTVKEMSLNQKRGVFDCEFTLDQVGIEVVDNQFVQKEQKIPNLENRINAIEKLRFLNPKMTLQEARDIAIKLNSFQLKGFLYLGFSLKQVMSKQYKDCEETLIGKILDKSGINFFIPEEEQGNARKAFDEILEKNSKVSKGTEKILAPISEMIIPLKFEYPVTNSLNSTTKQQESNSEAKASAVKEENSGYKPYKLK